MALLGEIGQQSLMLFLECFQTASACLDGSCALGVKGEFVV
jgi:hypothetical protein